MFDEFRRPLRLCCLCVPTFVSSLKISICRKDFLLASKLVSDLGRTGSLLKDRSADLERSALERAFDFLRASARSRSLWGDEDLLFLPRRGSFLLSSKFGTPILLGSRSDLRFLRRFDDLESFGESV